MKIFFHPEQLKHEPQSYLSRGKMREPQEKPQRMHEILKALNEMELAVSEPSDFGIDPLLEIHTPGFIEFLKTAHKEWMELPEDWGNEVMSNVYIRDNNRELGILAKAAKYLADGSAPVGEHTWISSYWSAQTALACADVIKQGESLAIGLTRPAGHHARKDGAGGFCYINNAAVIAQNLLKQFKKVAIIDTDMHHGQGIQEIFYDRNDVLYVSVHGDPVNFYPVVAGFADEHGKDKGYGYNRNFPMPHGTSEAGFFEYVDQAISYLTNFNPDVIVHVMGFDVYVDDPQAKCSVSTSGFEILGQKIAQLNAPVISLIEGGYCIEKLGVNMQSFIKGLQAR